MSENKQVYLTDLAQSDIDDACPMKTWYSRLEGGAGLLRRASLLGDRMMGETYSDLRYLANLIDIGPEAIQHVVDGALLNLTDTDKLDQQRMELLYRRLGWFVGFALYIEPTMRKIYERIPIEAELILDHDPLFVVVQVDRLYKCKATGDVTYLNFVPMPPGLTNKKWLEQWIYNIRLHVGMMAVDEAHKSFYGQPVKCADGQVVGLSEGYYSSVDNRLIHPYVWAYRSKDRTQWSPGFKASSSGEWEQAPVWEFPGGIVNWVQVCGESMAKYQFQFSSCVLPDHYLVDEWCSRRLHRERAIRIMSDICHTNFHLRNIHFQKNTAQCRPAQGEQCPYLLACWTPTARNNPFLTGEFIPNVVPDEVKEAVVVT